MSRIIVGQDARPIVGQKFTAALIELDDGKRVHVQLYGSRSGLFARVTTMKWRGLVPDETLFDDDSVLFDFANLGPQDLSPDQRTYELLRRLTKIALECRSVAEVRNKFDDLNSAGLYDNARWILGQSDS